MGSDWINKIGFVAAVLMPLWNIPLILRIIKRRSSRDISLWWALGVWTCIVLMFPSGLRLEDVVWRTFNILNFIFFSMVALVTIVFHKGKK